MKPTITAFELRRELLREFYALEEITLDTCEFVPPKINAKIHKDNFAVFKKTLKKLWRKHKSQKDFFTLAVLVQLQKELTEKHKTKIEAVDQIGQKPKTLEIADAKIQVLELTHEDK